MKTTTVEGREKVIQQHKKKCKKSDLTRIPPTKKTLLINTA